MDVEVVETVTKTIGTLGLAYPYLRKLGVAEIIDGLTTSGKQRQVRTGQVIEVLILNRLSLRPTPISKVSAWAERQAIEEIYGVAAEALNDDRIGRALDEIHAHLVDAWAAIVLQGAQAYQVQLQQVHSDVTRLAFEGAYDEVATRTEDGQALARISYGYNGNEAPGRKQVTLSVSVAGDGGLPVWYLVADGQASDTRAYLRHLDALRTQLHLDQPLVVGDSKLITQPNMLGFCRVGARFIGPKSLTASDQKQLRQLWQAGSAWQRLDLPAEGEPATPGRYWGLESSEQLTDPQGRTAYPLRRLFIMSLADRQATRQQRAKELWRAHHALWSLTQRLSRPVYRDRALVERKVAQAISKVAPFLKVEIVERPDGLDLRWRLDRSRLQAQADFDGIYCLLTNIPACDATLLQLFHLYKAQSKVEHRFRVVKQPPIQVRPLWLHQPQRIESLIFVVMVALFLFALIEREARRVVQATGQLFTGLRPEGRDSLPVTAHALFEAFAPLSLVKQRLQIGAQLVDLIVPTTLSAVQSQILERLGLAKPDAYVRPRISPHPP